MTLLTAILFSFCFGFLLATFTFAISVFVPMKKRLAHAERGWRDSIKVAKDMLQDFKEAVEYMKQMEEQLNGTEPFQKDGQGNIISPLQRGREGS